MNFQLLVEEVLCEGMSNIGLKYPDFKPSKITSFADVREEIKSVMDVELNKTPELKKHSDEIITHMAQICAFICDKNRKSKDINTYIENELSTGTTINTSLFDEYSGKGTVSVEPKGGFLVYKLNLKTFGKDKKPETKTFPIRAKYLDPDHYWDDSDGGIFYNKPGKYMSWYRKKVRKYGPRIHDVASGILQASGVRS